MRPCKDILTSLMTLDRPLKMVYEELPYCDDSRVSEPVAILTRKDVLSVIQRYLTSEISNEEIQDWADTLIGRDDIDREKGFNDAIMEVLHYLSIEPDHGVPLTPEQAHMLINELQAAVYDPNEDD